MLRWTGGSRARSSFQQPAAPSYRAGAHGTDTGVNVGRCHNMHKFQQATTSHEQRLGRQHSCDGRNVLKGFSRGPRESGDACVSTSHEGAGKRSLASSTGDDGEVGVDCTALEWSVKAAAAAAAVTAPRQETPEGWAAPACKEALPHLGLGEHALALDAPTHPDCNYAPGECTVEAQVGSGGAEPRYPGCGVPGADAQWTEVASSPPLHVPEWENELGPPLDDTTLAPQGCFLWHLPESAEEWELQCWGHFPPPLMLGGEVHQDPMNAFLDRHVPFTSSGLRPEADQTIAFVEEPVTALTNDEFSCGLLYEEYNEPAATGGCGGEYATCIASDGFPDAGTTHMAVSRGWRTPTHRDRYAEPLDPAGVEGTVFPSTSQMPFAVRCSSPESPGTRPSAALGLASLLTGVNQSQTMPHAEFREPFMRSGRGRGGQRAAWPDLDVAMQEPYGARLYPGFHSSAPEPPAARGGRARGTGRGSRRGQSLNLFGGVPSARFQAFQRRHRRG
ncbi:hypothetical protein TRSC58_06610 [Trypanosoma rangeli SC58]|uniref:Uncharacterized protein n=1 Tax=Trypanosoma rangeli SC58 TaxID=429131 RepID=A0A061IT68_TRYRA|nr:hypothetical protein TRSC58_06610 [Trypanosoma rangeli SC58]